MLLKLKNIANFQLKIAVKQRYISSKTASEPKPEKSAKVGKDVKISKNLLSYFSADERNGILQKFPESLCKRKQKPPDLYYVADQECAQQIAKLVGSNVPKGRTLLEINPGPGLLTKELIKRGFTDIQLYESDKYFEQSLNKLVKSNQKVKHLVYGDFIGMYRLAYQDRLDQGNRLEEYLFHIPRKSWLDEVNCTIVASTGSINFFKQLISSIVFQNGLFSTGRCELFLLIPPPLFMHLTCSNKSSYLLYRATTILFQILFEYEYIEKVPRNNFLPWQFEYVLSTAKKMSKYNVIDSNCLYMVRVVPRKNLYEFLLPDNLPAFWFFVKQSCISRKNRVIPTMESWIPSSGARLIMSNKNHEPVSLLNENIDLKKLEPTSVPKEHHTPAKTLSVNDFYPGINIFTQFGDMTPSQILTLYNQFLHWPEYAQCPFLASMETRLMKLEATSDTLDMDDEEDLPLTRRRHI